MNLKELKPSKIPNSPHYKIVFEGGGTIPDRLQGMYTSEGAALLAIEQHKAVVQSIIEEKGSTRGGTRK
jgi:hypothetical protein